jgi:hypothetical protein
MLGVVGYGLFTLTPLMMAHLAAVLAVLVLVVLVLALLTSAGRCGGVHCSGCKRHR